MCPFDLDVGSVTVGVKVARGRTLSKKEEVLKNIVKAKSLDEAQYLFKDDIHELRSTSSGLVQNILESFPRSLTDEIPGFQDPEGFIYSVCTMVIRTINEDPTFFDDFFDPLSMRKNTGTSFFLNLPNSILLTLMNRIAEKSGLSSCYFKDFTSVERYVIRLRGFFQNIYSGANPYTYLSQKYGKLFKDQGFDKEFQRLDQIRLQRFRKIKKKNEYQMYCHFLETYKQELKIHQNAHSIQKYPRKLIYNLLILAFIDRDAHYTSAEKEYSDQLIRRQDKEYTQQSTFSYLASFATRHVGMSTQTPEENQELLNLINMAGRQIGLGRNYVEDFSDIRTYAHEFVQFFFCQSTLEGRYRTVSEKVRSFMFESIQSLQAAAAAQRESQQNQEDEEDDSVLVNAVETEHILNRPRRLRHAPEPTVHLFARIQSLEVLDNAALYPDPPVAIQERNALIQNAAQLRAHISQSVRPTYWRARHRVDDFSHMITHPRQTASSVQKAFHALDRIVKYVIGATFGTILSTLAYLFLLAAFNSTPWSSPSQGKV